MTEPRTPPLQSRLPQVGTTIFTVMSALAAEVGAVNLGQGFPDFDCDPRLQALVTEAMRAGHNQYAPMAGVPIGLAWIAALMVSGLIGAVLCLVTRTLRGDCRFRAAARSSGGRPGAGGTDLRS